MKTFKEYTEPQTNVPASTVTATTPNAVSDFVVGDKVMCPGGSKGTIRSTILDANTKAIKYLVVNDETGVVNTFPGSDLTRVSSVVGPKDNIVPVGTTSAGTKVESVVTEKLSENEGFGFQGELTGMEGLDNDKAHKAFDETVTKLKKFLLQSNGITADEKDVVAYLDSRYGRVNGEDLLKIWKGQKPQFGKDIVRGFLEVKKHGRAKMMGENMKTFKQYCLTEEVSDSDKKKLEELGHETAKSVFGDKYDKDQAQKVIDGVIEKNKDKTAEEIGGILKNSFR